MTIPQPVTMYTLGTGTASTAPLIPVFRNTDPAPTDSSPQYVQGQRWINQVTNQEFVLTSFTSVTGQVLANWVALGTITGAPLNTLTGDVGAAVTPFGFNIDIQGGVAGAIRFSNGGAVNNDLLSAQVLVDGVTIGISGNKLVAANTFMFSLSTAGAATDVTGDIPIPFDQTTIVNVDFAVINFATQLAGAANLASGGARDDGGAVTIIGIGDFVDVSLNEDPALALIDYNLIPGVAPSTVRIQVIGVAGQNLNWKACVKLCSTP